MRQFRHLDGVATLRFHEKKCVGCGLCESVCPQRVFLVDDRKARVLDRDLCTECGACAKNCAAGALVVRSGAGCATEVLWGWFAGGGPDAGRRS